MLRTGGMGALDVGWPVIGAGLLLGLRHALDADHLAALGTLLARGGRARDAAAMGASWGAGHGAALLGLGGVLIALEARVPERFASVLELGVAAMLLVLGVRSIRAALSGQLASTGKAPRSPLAAFAIGLVHGAAGTASLTLVLLTTLGSAPARIGFLFAFALGALVAMALLSALVALPLVALARRRGGTLRAVHAVAGGMAIVAAALVTMDVYAAVGSAAETVERAR
jgi:nickel/cobalt transporter (NicO) family protein